MTRNEIDRLIATESLPDSQGDLHLKETHISWIIVTDHHAFKIKKPVEFSFLDFSTLEQRKYYCDRELELNRRLAPEMYQEVVPIYGAMVNDLGRAGEVIDYMVKMKKMDWRRQMDRMLKNERLTEDNVLQIASKVAAFHRKTKVIRKPFDLSAYQQRYADLLSVEEFAKQELGQEWSHRLSRQVERSNQYLTAHQDYLEQRFENGMVRDGHGDLNSRNIFIYDDPVIFDCIEYSDEFRQLDVLDDIAFLCMDLDFHGREELGNLFYQEYTRRSDHTEADEAHNLLRYYKNYRASVRLKIILLQASEKGEELGGKEFEAAERYLELMER